MDIIRLYFHSNYWKRIFFAAETAITLLSAIGFFWLMTEILSFIFESWKEYLQKAWPFFLLLSTFYTIWRRHPVALIRERINGSDITIEIRIADIFSVSASRVISTNSTFDTAVNNYLISSQSLQGIFTQKFYDDVGHLDTDLLRALEQEPVISTRESRVGGKTNRYRIGTVAKIAPRDNTTYFLAISHLNENGVAESSIENVRDALASLWAFVSSKGSYEPLVIPIIGTGRGRVNVTRVVVIREIIKSFIAACSERRFTEKLIIVISPRDSEDHGIDLYELGGFLKYICHYTEILSRNRGSGTEVGQ